MPSPTTIILCGGDINTSNLPIATSGSNAMIPVNGKPVIGWILEDLLEKQTEHIVLVTQSKNEQLLDFVKWAFQKRLTITFALLETKESIIHSLLAGLQKVSIKGPVTVLLGDTLINAPLPKADNFVLVSDQFDDPRNWCLVLTDKAGVINQYFDKKKDIKEGLLALTGLYQFSNSVALSQASEKALAQGNRELSDVLSIYSIQYPIIAIPTEHWCDFGHLPHFLVAKRALLQSRYFNQLQIEEVTGIMRKTSHHSEKLRDEYHWYLELPDELKVLTPRILGKQENGDSFTIVQEYYGYPNLAELYLFGNLNIEIWKTTIHNLMSTHLRLKKFSGAISHADAWHIYWEKTELRIAELVANDAFFQKLTVLEHIWCNEQYHKN